MTPESLAAKARNPAVALLLRAETGPIDADFVYRLCERARQRMRVDVHSAAIAADAAYAAARGIADGTALAEALRLKGHISYLGGKYRQAVAAYRRAIHILDRGGRHVDVGRTLSSALQSLIYLSRYDEALAWGERARLIFDRENDALRLARLDSNIGNILHRQDRYGEALALYRRAVEQLRACGDWDSSAIALRNMAVCHAALHDFDDALAAYREAERLYRERDLPLLAAEVDDNIAHLYYLRGDYWRALSLYRSSDVEGRGNTYHMAIARLDRSDLLLDLNLFSEAAKLAEDSAARLAHLGVRYERAKALVNLAIGSFRMGETQRALRLLTTARELFGREKNSAWQATCDIYRASLLLETDRLGAARQAALAAVETIGDTSLFGKTILALLLLTRIEITDGRPAEYMVLFYSQLTAGQPIPGANRAAMIATREHFPHPFFWAPFAITGHTGNLPGAIFSGVRTDPIRKKPP
ncbi:MAG: tetratricopeptide repeat protein [Bryobacteraceae bacterium]